MSRTFELSQDGRTLYETLDIDNGRSDIPLVIRYVYDASVQICRATGIPIRNAQCLKKILMIAVVHPDKLSTTERVFKGNRISTMMKPNAFKLAHWQEH